MGYNLLINGVYGGYNPLTNHLVISWDIQVVDIHSLMSFFSARRVKAVPPDVLKVGCGGTGSSCNFRKFFSKLAFPISF